MVIAVLAVQGAFAEHEKMLERMGISYVELRKKEDLQQKYDGIILPGGESTVQGKLLKELDMFDVLCGQIKDGMPVLATCAGLILLAEKIGNDEREYFKTLPVTVKRNAYGRQLGSFYTEQEFKGIGVVPMTFIRAPYIESVGEGTDILAEENGHIIAVRYKNQLAMSFHPELDKDERIHRYFIDIVQNNPFRI
ncbi:MAG: pyridoxal 5'-phosphate synthase glutaminase subunit PdxT [Butyrivibrio sp.]